MMPIQTANYDLVTTWRGGMASRTLCHSFAGGKRQKMRQKHVIDSDEPAELGGKGQAPNPQELMLAAFNACMTAAFVQEACWVGITLTHLEIQTCGQLLTSLSPLWGQPAREAPGRLQYVIRVSGHGRMFQFEQAHQRVIDSSLNRWLLAQNMTIEGDLIVL